MYLPAHYRNDDRLSLLELMRKHSFATLITAADGVPFATHLPLLVQEEGETLFLRSHMARANKQWQGFGQGEVLAIFHGPHALIDPAHYDSRPNVPTWNYAVVHAYGEASIIEGEGVRRIAYDLVHEHTPDMAAIPEDYERRLMAALVTFEIRVTRLEGKSKLSQNKTPQDRVQVAAALRESPHESERELGRLMEALL